MASLSLAAIEEEQSKISPLLGLFGKSSKRFKVAFLTKGEVLIYIAISKNKYESLTSLRKQLEVFHTQFIGITTQSLIQGLKVNPSFDVVNEFSDFYHILDG